MVSGGKEFSRGINGNFKMSETKYVAKLRKRYKERGYMMHKSAERFSTGWPDLTVVAKGDVFFIEAKYDKNEATKAQLFTLLKITMAGGIGLILTGNKDGTENLQRMTKTGALMPEMSKDIERKLLA